MFGHDDDKQLGTTPPNENLVGITGAPATSDDDDDEDIDQIVDDINTGTDDSNSDTPVPEPPVVDSPASEAPSELMEVKKSALQELSPLLDELDQTPEEKLNILMMTIQANDDQSLLPKALEAAKKIENKKARAEAMLDIIQEINYFTKKQ